MSAHNDLERLRGELLRTLERLARFRAVHADFSSDRASIPHNFDLIVLSEIFADFYTCAETAFFRISQFFENNLDREKWHRDLLHRMVLDIPGIRQRVIADETCRILDEFLRFRHFKRYYFDLEYDRDKMDYLEKKLIQGMDLVSRDLTAYLTFLEDLEKRSAADRDGSQVE